MPTATGPGYVVRRQDDAPTVPCPCGASTRILTAADGGPCSLHVTRIHDSARHFHRETAEVYYILAGTGKIELNDKWFDLAPGAVVYIKPGTWHRVVSEPGLTVVVVAIPPFRDDDEHLV